MNTETGRILTQERLKAMTECFQRKSIPIDEQLMTARQRAQMQVSLHDNRSPLGKLRVKTKNKFRNQPCPCGSGRKFKNCCWNKPDREN